MHVRLSLMGVAARVTGRVCHLGHALGRRPGDAQAVTAADLFQPTGDALLQSAQAGFVACVRPQNESAGFGAQDAASPVEADHAVVIGALDLRAHLRMRLRDGVDVLA